MEKKEDPVVLVDRWLRQYLEHVKAPALARQVNHALVFRIVRTMYEQNQDIDDVQRILLDMAKSGVKPKGFGYLVTVIESRLGKVA